MIAGAELTAWLTDPARQKSSSNAVNAFASRWLKHPLMGDLRRELDAMQEPTPEAIQGAAERFLARQREIGALLDELIAHAAADPFFQPPFISVSSDIHAGLLLFDDPRLSIAVGVTGVDVLAAKKSGKRGPTSIGFTGLRTLFHFVKSGGATLSFWEAPAIGPDFVGGEGGRCRSAGRRTIADGETVAIDGSRESFVIEHVRSDAVYLQAVVRVGAGPLAIEYDSKTLEFVGASSADEEASRVQMMATLLRMMDRQDAVPVVREALNSPHFFTRWHIMRELLAIDAGAALPELEKMADKDPHPEVRAAAAETLRAFFGDRPDKRGEAA